MIRIENIKKSFSSGDIKTMALNGVSMEVQKGEFVAVMGPSGCGKTTLLNILGLLDRPDEGRYFLDGTDTSSLSETEKTKMRRGRIGFVFQSFNLIDELNVAENIELPLTYIGVPKQERQERVRTILKKLSIGHRADHFPYQLSGGQQQRVAIARALVYNPALVLADEPTGNLDSANGTQVMELLKTVQQEFGTTIIMVTHNQRDALYADKTLNLLDGSVIDKKALL